jgi:hypothetical protein
MAARLSTLWAFATLNYLYCDVVMLFDQTPGSFELSRGALLGAAVLMEIPIGMVLVSRMSSYRVNRWSNIIAGITMTLVQAVTLFVATPAPYYMLFSAIEISCTAFVAWSAWKWRLQPA